MRIPNIARRVGDWGFMPMVFAGVTMGASYKVMTLDKRYDFSGKLFSFDKQDDRRLVFVALGFSVTLAGCLALIKALPFTQFTWGRPHFNWTVIEGYLNRV